VLLYSLYCAQGRVDLQCFCQGSSCTITYIIVPQAAPITYQATQKSIVHGDIYEEVKCAHSIVCTEVFSARHSARTSPPTSVTLLFDKLCERHTSSNAYSVSDEYTYSSVRREVLLEIAFATATAPASPRLLPPSLYVQDEETTLHWHEISYVCAYP
jgi:hypothetical protein